MPDVTPLPKATSGPDRTSTAYRQLRADVLADGVVCERCAQARAVLLHHRRRTGRGGAACLRDNVAALCDSCHQHVHAHVEQARRDGWLVHEGDPDWHRLGEVTP